MSSLHKKQMLWCYAFLLPQLVMFLVFTLWPIAASYYFAFFNWNGIGWPDDFVGFANFKETLTDPYFWNAFKNSLIYAVALVVIVVPTALIIALILNSPKLKGAVFFRTMIFLPIVLTMSIIGIVMSNLFSTRGFINQSLLAAGVIHQPINWLTGSATAMIALVLVGVWKGFGIKVIYWLAGLQTLPAEIYEAARIDGANRWQEFRFITIPLLIPFFIIIVFFQTIWALNVFDLVKTFTNGGPFFATDVVPLYIYRYAFEIEGGLPRMGFASAAGIIYGMATMLISAVLGTLVRKYGGQKIGH